MNQTPDGGAAGLGFEMKMTGEGTMDVNIDRGFAQATEWSRSARKWVHARLEA